MPTLFIVFGFRFMFYSNDHEPIHVHVIKGNAEARFQVLPEVTLIDSKGLKPAELKLAGSPFGIHWPHLDEDLSFEGFFAH